ncbi:hypothetical protein KFE80_03835 [bacterium SCSIO 12696]|nr:hypothetical protein KFE80_03835 [bacterium SCSIO 12696]
MLHFNKLPEEYLPSVGHLIWLRSDNVESQWPHFSGYRPVFVLSAEPCGVAGAFLTILPVLGLGAECAGAIKIPYELYSKGYVLICEPIIVQCPRHHVSLIEPMPQFFIEHIQYALNKTRNP